MSQIEINGEKKEYVLTRRKGMKSIRFRLDENGVILVSAPYRVSVSFIENVMKEHGAELIAGRQHIDEAHKRWEQFVREKLKDVPDWQIKDIYGDIVAGDPFEKDSIFNGMSLVSTRIEFQNMFFNALKIFREEHAAPVTSLTFQHMVSRWGSCRPKTGRMTFNLLLLYVPKDCAEYVIYHELCHFLVPNHSKQFWAYVAGYVPDYKRIEKELNDYGKILIEHTI
jgi:predicted metal-dependent hydrolase